MDTTESHPSKIPEAPNHVFVYKRSHLRILQRLLNSLSSLTETAGTSVGESLTFFKLLFYMKKKQLGVLQTNRLNQGRNQERANQAIAPSEIFANMMAFTCCVRKVIFSILLYFYVNFSIQFYLN